jgi:cytochrome c-type biogenesis protein CcmH/NrfG
MRICRQELRRNEGSRSGSDLLRWRVLRHAIILALGIAFAAELGGVSFAQRTTSTSSKRGFILYGDVKVDESQAAEPGPAVLDVILYTNGNQVFARQRITPNGRYRFMDVFDGDYYVSVEFENREVARASVYIAPTSPVELKQDISLEWRSNGLRSKGAGVVSVADFYNRSSANKLLYQKSAQQIAVKNYADAIASLLQVVSSDPKDFPAWSDLGMLYFIQKDYEAAENSYASALAAKPNHFIALLSLGRVQMARKNYERAIASLEAALKLDSKSASANFFLGEAYLQIKKGSKAVGYLNEALSLDPVGMAEAHLRLAALYNGAGMKDKAAVEYEQFLKTKPDYPDRKKLEEYISANKKP